MKIPKKTIMIVAILAIAISVSMAYIHYLSNRLRLLREIDYRIKSFPTSLQTSSSRAISLDRKIELEHKNLELENSLITTSIQALGGFFFLLSAYFTWRSLQISEDQQLTDRFVKAIDLLSHEKTEIRIGGLFALERIAIDSPEDHWRVMEMITSFIRKRSPVKSDCDNTDLPQITEEIQIALNILRRRDKNRDPKELKTYFIDLHETNLTKADLRGCWLEGASFINSSLIDAYLDNAVLNRATFRHSDLRNIWLDGAKLENTRFYKANLEGASLSGSNMNSAYLMKSNFKGANVTEDQLSQAKLCQTILPDGINLDPNRNCEELGK